MRRSTLRRLRADAVESYAAGYIAGTNMRLASTKEPRYVSTTRPYCNPAYDAGYNAGCAGERIREGEVPLSVWVDVLAQAQWEKGQTADDARMGRYG